jgi:hypothetical protein
MQRKPRGLRHLFFLVHAERLFFHYHPAPIGTARSRPAVISRQVHHYTLSLTPAGQHSKCRRVDNN